MRTGAQRCLIFSSGLVRVWFGGATPKPDDDWKGFVQMTVSQAVEIHGKLFEVHSNGCFSNEPQISIPLSTVQDLTDDQLVESIKGLMDAARKLMIEGYADWVRIHIDGHGLLPLEMIDHPAVVALLITEYRSDAINVARAAIHKTQQRRQAMPMLKKVRTQFNRERNRLFDEIAERDGARCAQCGDLERLTVDHIQPIAQGGTNDIGNLQILCHSCNVKKGSW